MRSSFSILLSPLLCAPLAAQSVLHQFDGDASAGQLGFAVSTSGDLNADGVPDIAYGAPSTEHAGITPGMVRVHSGVDGSVLLTLYGATDFEQFGASVDFAGDVDGDGHDDLVVGADLADPNGDNSGQAFVFSGRDGSVLHTFSGAAAGDGLGTSVAGAGDVNADGYDDVIVGVPYDDGVDINSGAATVYSGVDGSVLHAFQGSQLSDRFGWSVSPAGDVDDDGFADVIVGAPQAFFWASGPSYARVFSGFDGSVLHELTSGEAADQFGQSVSDAGDVDGDGHDDLVVGAPFADRGVVANGAVRVFSGATGQLLHLWEGQNPFDECGTAVHGAGDVNGDGYDDVIASSPIDPTAHVRPSEAYVYSGFDGTILRTLVSTPTYDQYGWAVSGGTDIDGDGFDDVAIGAPVTPVSGNSVGRVYVFDGGFSGTPSGEITFGLPCPGSFGLPRIGARGRARVGQTMDVTLRGAPPSTPTVTLFLGDATAVPLDFLGLVGCTLYNLPIVTLPIGSDALGLARVPIEFLPDPATIGVRLAFQWAVPDSGVPFPITVTFSDGLEILIGG